jgi:hypothetical protein
MPDPTGSATRRRLALSWFALTVASVAGVACTGADEASTFPDDATVITLGATGGTDQTVATSSSVDDSAATAGDVPEAPTATVPIDAPGLLQAALVSLDAGYHFRTTVSISGTEVLVADGERVGDGTRLTIWSNGTSVAYVITPDGSWVFPEGGEWQALDTAPATTDPLLALRTPTAVTGSSTDGVVATLVATVAANSLGVPSDSTADVVISVNGSSLSDVSYDASVDGQTANVRSVFGPVVDPTPVAAPI